MSSNNIICLVRATLGALSVILITAVMLPEPVFATHRSFAEAEKWTDYEFYGDHGTFFADITGDGMAAIGVNNDAIWYRQSTGSRFEGDDTKGKKQLTTGPFYGDLLYEGLVNQKEGTFFADVDGDGKADPIAVYKNKPIKVRESKIAKRKDWTTSPFYGEVDTFFADVDGDGRADAIAVNQSNVIVKRSKSFEFGPEEEWLSHSFSRGKQQIFLANVTNITGGEWTKGKGKADLIVVAEDGVRVWYSYGNQFRAENQEEGDLWTKGIAPAFYGTLSDPKYQATFFADVNGDGLADAIAINDGTRIVGDNGIGVRESINNNGSNSTWVPAYKDCGRVDSQGRCYVWQFPGGFHSPHPETYEIRLRGDEPVGPWGYWTRGRTEDAFYGTRGTFFADVDGNGTADAIAVRDDGVWVRRSCVGIAPSDPCFPPIKR